MSVCLSIIYSMDNAFCRLVSDLGNLQDPGDIDPEKLESLAVEAFERRISSLDKENKVLEKKLQGTV